MSHDERNKRYAIDGIDAQTDRIPKKAGQYLTRLEWSCKSCMGKNLSVTREFAEWASVIEEK